MNDYLYQKEYLIFLSTIVGRRKEEKTCREE
jgi:hypothetical protein